MNVKKDKSKDGITLETNTRFVGVETQIRFL
jgi:hypothetical protein